MVVSSKHFLQTFLLLVVGKGVGLVEVRKNTDGILGSTQVSKDKMKRFPHCYRFHFYLITVELHHRRLHTEGTRLVESSASR